MPLSRSKVKAEVCYAGASTFPFDSDIIMQCSSSYICMEEARSKAFSVFRRQVHYSSASFTARLRNPLPFSRLLLLPSDVPLLPPLCFPHYIARSTSSCGDTSTVFCSRIITCDIGLLFVRSKVGPLTCFLLTRLLAWHNTMTTMVVAAGAHKSIEALPRATITTRRRMCTTKICVQDSCFVKLLSSERA